MDFTILIAGFGGGMVRGIVGFIKYQYSYKSIGFHLYYFLVMVFLSGIVGLLTAAVLGEDPLIAFIAGYAGGDIIENAYKIIQKKITLYPLPE